MKALSVLLTASALVGLHSLPAVAHPGHGHGAKPAASCCQPSAHEGCECAAPTKAGRAFKLDQATALRHSGSGRSPEAIATVYSDRAGALTGVRLSTSGLPDPERLDGRASQYMVWLFNSETQQVQKLGALESRNRGQAVFGFSPAMPLEGFDRLLVTAEPAMATHRPGGVEHLAVDLNRGCEAGCCKE